MKRLACVLLALTLSACVSHYAEGPRLGTVQAPRGHGVIYVVRPPKQFGAMQTIWATVDRERWFGLYSGSCGAFYVEPGRVLLSASIETWAEVIVIHGAGISGVAHGTQVDGKRNAVVVDVPEGGAVYVTVEFDGWKEPPIATVVPDASGQNTMEGCHMSPGGRPRLPGAAKPSAPPPEAPAAEVVDDGRSGLEPPAPVPSSEAVPAQTKPTNPKPTAAEKPCFPDCREGFTCVKGACVSACNPPCAAHERCTRDGECVSKGGAAAPPPVPKPAPPPVSKPAPPPAPPAPSPEPEPAPAPAPAPVVESAPETPAPDAPPAPASAPPQDPAPVVEATPPQAVESPGLDLTGHLLIAPGLGLQLALGDTIRDSPQSDTLASPGFGFTLDAGFGVSRSIVLGLWSEFSLHGAGAAACRTQTPGAHMECVTAVIGVGPQLQYFIPTSGRTRPWFGAGFGFRWLRIATLHSAGGTDAGLAEVLSGQEWLRLQGGIDFQVSSHVLVGPFLAFSVGSYTNYSMDGELLSYDAASNRYRLVPATGSFEIQDTAVHQYLFIGGRVAFDLMGTTPAGRGQ